MKINGNEIRIGYVIEWQGRQYTVIKANYVSPGKGGAFTQLEMRDVRGGSKTNVKVRSDETVERLHVDEKDCTYLFADGENLTFMDTENYEQISVSKDMVGEAADFLQDGMPVTVNTIEGSPVAVNLPTSVTMAVSEADPVVRGQTAASSYKPAILENGVRVMVPPFIEKGTRIVVNIAERSYMERAKD